MNIPLLPPPNPGIVWKSATATDTADTLLIAHIDGLQFVITDLFICNVHATTGAGVTLKGPRTDLGPFPAASGFGGCVGKLNTPIPLIDGADLKFAQSASGTTTVTVGGYWTNKGGF